MKQKIKNVLLKIASLLVKFLDPDILLPPVIVINFILVVHNGKGYLYLGMEIFLLIWLELRWIRKRFDGGITFQLRVASGSATTQFNPPPKKEEIR